jgi:hypothetical protein
MDEGSGDIGLSAALEALRQELDEAWAAGAGERIRFQVSDITLVVQVVARRQTQGGGKLRWWILEAGAEQTRGKEMTQTLTLKLTPAMGDQAVASSPQATGQREADR